MKRSILLACLALPVAAAPALATQITLGASLGTAYDLVSTGSGTIFADTPGFFAPAVFTGDLGTVPLGAHFGATTFTTGPQVNGVFPVVAGGAEPLTVAFPDGDNATGTAHITQVDDGSPNPHIAFTWDYTAAGDPAFLAAFPGGVATGEYIFQTVATLLDNFVQHPGDEFLSGSAGEIDSAPAPVPEPSTLLGALGLGLICSWRLAGRRGHASAPARG